MRDAGRQVHTVEPTDRATRVPTHPAKHAGCVHQEVGLDVHKQSGRKGQRAEAGRAGEWRAEGGRAGEWRAEGGRSGEWQAQEGRAEEWPAEEGRAGEWRAQQGRAGMCN